MTPGATPDAPPRKVAMTDNDTPPQDAPAPDAPSPAAGTDKPEDNAPADGDTPLGPNGEKALASERDARKAAEKANADLTARLKNFEDRDKTELQKLTEARDTAEQAAKSSALELLRYRVAADTNVDPDLLAGTDEETMRAHASRLIAWRGVDAQGKPPAPRPDLSQGARGQADTVDAQIAEAESNGDYRTAIQLKARKQIQTATK